MEWERQWRVKWRKELTEERGEGRKLFEEGKDKNTYEEREEGIKEWREDVYFLIESTSKALNATNKRTIISIFTLHNSMQRYLPK